MIRKYLVSTAGKQYYITKFHIIKIDDTLRFCYDIYLITSQSTGSIIKTIDQSFITNPESDSIFEKLPKDLKFSKNISQLEAIEVLTKIEEAVNANNRSSTPSQFIAIQLPQARLFYEINKVKLLYNFIKTFCDNYDLIKLNFDRPIENKDKIKKDDDIVLTAKSENPQNISSLFFEELVKLSPNNIVTFFILKQLATNYTNQQVKFELDESGNLSIHLTKIMNNLMLLYNDLMVIVNFRPKDISDENYKGHIKFRIQELIKLIISIYRNREQLNNNDLYLYLNFVLISLYVYGFWLNDFDLNSGPNLYNFVNKILISFKIPKDIKFIPTELIQDNTVVNVDLGKINKLASKYKYLIEIDRNKFIDNIIKDSKKDEISNQKHLELPSISKTRMLDLVSEHLPLNYEIITDVSLSDHKIISKAYHSYLIVENSKNLFTLDNIDENLRRFIDLINTKLIPTVNKYTEQIKLNPSTMFIYTECIRPNITSPLLSIQEQFYLLYDIIIPYLFDVHNITKITDYFH